MRRPQVWGGVLIGTGKNEGMKAKVRACTRKGTLRRSGVVIRKVFIIVRYLPADVLLGCYRWQSRRSRKNQARKSS